MEIRQGSRVRAPDTNSSGCPGSQRLPWEGQNLRQASAPTRLRVSWCLRALENSGKPPGTAERRESEERHHDRISNRKTEKPRRHFAMPLTPGGHGSVQSKRGE